MTGAKEKFNAVAVEVAGSTTSQRGEVYRTAKAVRTLLEQHGGRVVSSFTVDFPSKPVRVGLTAQFDDENMAHVMASGAKIFASDRMGIAVTTKLDTLKTGS